MREPGRNGPPTMFFGRVMAHGVVDIVDAGKEKPRPRLWSTAKRPKAPVKPLPIAPSSAFSRHVVDLSSFSDRGGGPDGRPELDLEQKLSVFAHSVRSAVIPADEEHRAPISAPRKRSAPHAPIGDFLRLPFALAALPFKTRQMIEARRPKPARRAVPAAPPKPLPQSVPQATSPAPYAPSIKTMPRPKRRFAPVFGSGWWKRPASFAAIAIVISLPLQALLGYGGLMAKAGAIAAGAKEAASGLRDAGRTALGNDGDQASFDRAAGAFAETRDRVDDISVRLAALLTGNGRKLASGERLLAAGESVSRAGAEMAGGIDAMRRSSGTVAEKLAAMMAALDKALPHLKDAASELDRVPMEGVPASMRASFQAIRDDAGGAVEDLERASSSSSALLDAIGANGKRRYLVVFENSDELRPTGGFIGSYALMDLEDGSIRKIEIPPRGSYDLRAGFNQLIAAPEQLRLVNPRWEFQDANWFADFPTSARSLIWFYEKSGGPTVDGVIAVTSNVMSDLLRQVGPIDLPEHGKTITADNFQEETQKSVEIEYDRGTNNPKQIISDMAPKVLKALLDGGARDLPALASTIGASLASKDIQVYFNDPSAQAAAAGFGWTGALGPRDGGDFLSVVDTNIAGGKTDGVVSEDVHHETRFEPDGGIVDTITVTRTHHGKAGELFTGIKNIDYLRAYVPKGSQLLSAEGFKAPGEGYFLPQDDSLRPSTLLSAVEGEATTEPMSGTRISQESGLTVFGNWVQLEPGETRSVTLKYRLPFRLQDLAKRPVTRVDQAREMIGLWTTTAPMKLIVRKQPGARNRTFSERFHVPDGWQIKTSVPADAVIEPDGRSLTTPLDKDLYVGLLLVRSH